MFKHFKLVSIAILSITSLAGPVHAQDIDPNTQAVIDKLSDRVTELEIQNRLNRVQFLTIRQFLSLVFCALVLLLLVLAVWS